MNNKLCTIQETADILGVSTKTLRRWDQRGRFVPTRTAGNQRRYTQEHIQQFKVSTSAKATVDKAKIRASIPQGEPFFKPETTREIKAVHSLPSILSGLPSGSFLKNHFLLKHKDEIESKESLRESAKPAIPDKAGVNPFKMGLVFAGLVLILSLAGAFVLTKYNVVADLPRLTAGLSQTKDQFAKFISNLPQISLQIGRKENEDLGFVPQKDIVGIVLAAAEGASDLILNVNVPSFFSQQMGIGTTTVNPSALLDISSEDKGFLAPRMTTTQRDAISSPATGLFVYNTDTNHYNMYNGTAWQGVFTSLGDSTVGEAFTEKGTSGNSLYFHGTGGGVGQVTGGAISGTQTYTLPGATGTFITTGNLTDITKVGTIGSGVWNGTTLTVANGGTGVTTLTGIVLGNGTSVMTGLTTSLGISGAISDETGTGVLVFGTSPAITTSLTTASTTFALLNTTATTVNFAGAATTLSIGATTGTATINNAATAITGALTANGNVTLGDAATDTITFTGRVAQDADLIPIGTTGTNDLGSSSLPWDNAYADNLFAASSGTSGYWQRNSNALSPTNITDDVLIGATSTSSAKFGFLNVAGGNPTATISGNLSLIVPTTAGANTFNLLNNSTLNFQRSPGGDAGLATALFINSAGNVGIGTTAPGGALHVVGNCVTGDTLLKKRRRKKGKNGEWIDEWEDVPIKDIQPGDEILTLDETTGEFTVSEIKALMDMGTKDIIKITTISGKTIRTTANHPYLTAPKQLKQKEDKTFKNRPLYLFIDEAGMGNDPNQPYFGIGALAIKNTIDMNIKLHNIFERLLSAYGNEAPRSKLRGIKAEFLRSQQPHFAKASLGVPPAPSSSEQALRFSAKGNKKDNMEFKFSNITSNNKDFYNRVLDILFSSAKWEFAALMVKKGGKGWTPYSYWRRYLGNVIELTNLFPEEKLNLVADYLSKPNVSLKDLKSVLYKKNIENILQLESQGSLLLQAADILLGALAFKLRKRLKNSKVKEAKQEIADRVFEKMTANKKDGYKVTLYRLNAAIALSPCCNGSVTKQLPLVKGQKWVKVKDLAKGAVIATADGWEQITKLEKLPAEQVFDIEVEGTHNFVGGHYVNRKMGKALTEKQEKAYLEYVQQRIRTNADSLTSKHTDVVILAPSPTSLSENTENVKGVNQGVDPRGVEPLLPALTEQVPHRRRPTQDSLSQILGIDVNEEDIVYGGIVAHNTYIMSGNVGIGNTAPLTALDVTGSASLSANLSLRGAGTAHTFNILDNGTLNIQRSPGGDAGLATALFINSAGNVGIGTTAPGYKFFVERNDGVASGEHAIASLESGTTPGTGVAIGYRADGSAVTGGYIRSVLTTPLYLGTTTNQQTISILDNGRVGIGNTAPLTALDITGSASLSANLSLRGAGTAHTFNILDNGTLNIQRSPGGDAGLATALFIQNNGNVGIGNTAPGAMLSVGSSTPALISSAGLVTIANTTDSTSGSTGSINTAGGLGVTKDLAVDGGDIVTGATTFNLLNATATTINFAGVATTFTLGGTTGTASIRNTTVNFPNAAAVGIGNTAPLTALDVTGSASLSANLSLRGAGTAHTFNILDNGTLNIQRSPGGDAGLATALFINNAGNVGIGISAPGAKLHVSGGNILLDNDQGLQIKQSGGSITTVLTKNVNDLVLLSDGDGTQVLAVRDNGVNIGASYSISNLGTNNGLLVQGNVGIGNTAPLTALDVTGSASLSANLSLRGAGTAHTFNILDNGTLNIQRSPGGDAGLATALFIQNNGNVGIGNTAPGAMLSVGSSTQALISSAGLLTIANTTDSTSGSTGSINIAGGLGVTKDLAVDGGDIVTGATTFNLLNATATTINFAGVATTFTLGGTTGTASIRNTTVNFPNATAVGIGNTAPLTALDVTGSASLSANLSLKGAATAHTFNILDNGTLNIQRSPGGDAGLATALFINDAGNVGIGTTAPGQKLSVAGNLEILSGNNLKLWNTANSAVASFTFDGTNAGVDKGFYSSTAIYTPLIQPYSSTQPVTIRNSDAAYQALIVKGQASQTARYFDVQDSGSNVLFTVNNTGNVGIGITAPTSFLHVDGAATTVTAAFARAFVDNTNAITTNTGATAVYGLMIDEPNITIGTATPTTSASLYVSGAATEATTNYGIQLGAMTGATSTGLDIGALSGTTVNKSLNIGAISGTGATGAGITVGNISTTGATNYGINLGTMTGGTTSNYQINTGVLTSATTTTNAQVNLGGVVTTGGTTNYGINVGALSGTGTTNYGVNVNTLTSTGTTSYGLNIGGATGAATTNYGILIGAVSGATTNYGLYTTSGTTVLNATSGFVGIGNTAPLTALDVTGSASLSANLSLRGAGTAHTFNILDNGTLNIQRSPGGDAGLATALFIQNNGNIGIGTTGPGARLDVSGGNIANVNTLSGQTATDLTVQGGSQADLILQGNPSPTVNGNLIMKTSNGASVATERFRITGGVTTANAYFSNSNVGIGNTTPLTALDITGSASLSANLSLRGAGTAHTFNILDNGTLNIQRSPGGDAGLATALFINNAGNVGIGISAPGAKLHVSGGNILLDNDQGLQIKQSGGSITTVLTKNVNDLVLLSDGDGTQVLAVRDNGVNIGASYSVSNLGTNNGLLVQGNVGIGNTAPLTALDITGSASLSANLSLRGAGTAHTFNILDNGTLNIQRSPGGDAGLAANSVLYLGNDGNVGIGTTGPGAKLEVYDSGRSVLIGALDAESGIAANEGVDDWLILRGKGTGGLALNYKGGTGGTKFYNGSTTEAATISSTGNVQADGTLAIDGTGNSYIQGNVGIGTTSPTNKLHIFASSYDETIANSGQLRLAETAVYGGYIGYDETGATYFVFDNSYGGANSRYSFRFANSPVVTFLSSGNVGIGTTSPLLRLDVADSQAATAAAQIYNTSTDVGADGLILKLGNTSTTVVSSTNHFISFETAGIGIVGSVQGSGGAGVTYATSGIADFAEYFRKDASQDIPYGSVVCLKDNGLAAPCNNDSNKIIGVASERPAFLGGENLGDKSIAVGLVGQVRTRISTANGAIKIGDPLTTSGTSGVAVKATNVGQILGKAIEPFDSAQGKEGSILVSVNIGWYNPSVYVAMDGTLAGITATVAGIEDQLALQGDALRAQIASNSASLAAQTDYILANDPLFDSLNNKVMNLQSRVDLLSLQAEQQASISAFLAGITSGQACPPSAGASGDCGRVLGASTSAALNATLGDVELNNATISDSLNVLGRTTVTDLGVTGNINAGLLAIHGIDGEINTLSGDLKLQSLGLGGVNILNGKVVIDTTGNVKIAGTVTADSVEANTYTVLGDQSIGSGTIPTGASSVEISTPVASVSSKIFLTTTSLTDKQITVVEKSDGKFKVGIPLPTTSSISFDWWIVGNK